MATIEYKPMGQPMPTLPQSCAIVKSRLDDPDLSILTRTMAIYHVTKMETYNSITKADLMGALRWLFATYDFEGVDYEI